MHLNTKHGKLAVTHVHHCVRSIESYLFFIFLRRRCCSVSKHGTNTQRNELKVVVSHRLHHQLDFWVAFSTSIYRMRPFWKSGSNGRGTWPRSRGETWIIHSIRRYITIFYYIIYCARMFAFDRITDAVCSSDKMQWNTFRS